MQKTDNLWKQEVIFLVFGTIKEWGLLLKVRICSQREQILTFKSSPMRREIFMCQGYFPWQCIYWCFMSLSTLIRSYWDDTGVIMKSSVQWITVQSWAEFCLQRESKIIRNDNHSTTRMLPILLNRVFTFLTEVLSADDLAINSFIPYTNNSENLSNSSAEPINADVIT